MQIFMAADLERIVITLGEASEIVKYLKLSKHNDCNDLPIPKGRFRDPHLK